MLALTKADILGSCDRKIETVDVPEWGGTVFVRSLSAGERDAMDRQFTGKTGRVEVSRHGMAAYVMCDESGAPLFTTPEEIAALSEKSAQVIERIVEAGLRLSKIGQGEIEIARKNL